jgi:hypothetical protein
MHRSTLLELSGMELHELAHVHRCFAGELAHGFRHAVVTPLPRQAAMAERCLTRCSGKLAHAGGGELKKKPSRKTAGRRDAGSPDQFVSPNRSTFPPWSGPEGRLSRARAWRTAQISPLGSRRIAVVFDLPKEPNGMRITRMSAR